MFTTMLVVVAKLFLLYGVTGITTSLSLVERRGIPGNVYPQATPSRATQTGRPQERLSTESVEGVVCQYMNNMNITNTSGPLATPTYVDSQEACCASCAAAGPECKAAVFDSYRCILYGAAQYVPAVSGNLCIPQSTPTPAAPSSPTAVPAPTATPPPTSSPSSSTPPKNVSLVVRTECESSITCNLVADTSCTTGVLVLSECYSSTSFLGITTGSRWWCNESTGYAEQQVWHNGNCSGVEEPTVQHILGDCHIGVGGGLQYRQTRCTSLLEEVGHPVYRRSFTLNDHVVESSFTTFFRTGECYAAGTFEAGKSMMVFTGDNFVWLRTYDSLNCSGPERQHRSTPLNVRYQEVDESYIVWSTVDHNITQAPLPSTTPKTVGLMLRMECEQSATCSREEDTTCRSNAYVTDTCAIVNGKPTIHRCYPGYNGVIETYTDANCAGVPDANSYNINNTCYSSYYYRRNSCATVQLREGVRVNRTSCSGGPGSECTTVSFATGECNPDDNLYTQPYLIPYCGGDFVWLRIFGQSDCSAPHINTWTKPLDRAYTDVNNHYITWRCQE